MKTRSHLLRMSIILVAVLALKAMACDASSAGCGGCGQPLTKAIKFPIENGMQMRITSSGFNFIEQNVKPILESLLPNGLKFCVPGQCNSYSLNIPLIGNVQVAKYGICRNVNGNPCTRSTTYRDGICTNGCEVDINLGVVDLRPDNTNDAIQVYLNFDRINTSLLVKAEADIGVAYLTGSCNINVTSNSFPVTADLKLKIDPNTKRLTFDENLNARIDLANLNVTASATGNMRVCDLFDLVCGNVCSLVDGLLDGVVNTQIIRDLILSVAQQPISDAVNGFADTLRCEQCSASAPCPTGSTCQSGICRFSSGPSAGKCVPAKLGVEAEFDAGSLLASITPGLKATLRASTYAGGYADVTGNGVSAGMITGVDAEPNNCVPDVQPPDTSAVPRATALNSNFIPCAPDDTACIQNPQRFMAGVAVSERILNHAFFAIYRSGMLCLNAGSDLTDFLSTANFGLFLPSLNRLTGNTNRPMMLQVRPSQPPSLTLGSGKLRRDAQGDLVLDANGFPIIEEPLLTVRIPKLGLHFYAMVDNRLVRIFTITADVAIPMALYFKPDGSMAPVIGDLSQAFSNTVVSPSAILKEDPDILGGIIDIALQQALPLVVGALQDASIPIPDVQGFKLILDDRRIKTFESGSPVHKFIGIFTDLEFSPTTMAMRLGVDTTAKLVSLDVPPASSYRQRPLPRGRAVLELGGRGLTGTADDLEFQYRLNRGPWSLFTPARRITIESPLLLLQGQHVVEVRARHRDRQTLIDPTPAEVRFLVDSVAPRLDVRRRGNLVEAVGDDAVSPASRLRYAWKVGDGSWSQFGPGRTLDLSTLAGGRVKVDITVKDESGNETTVTRVYASHGRSTGTPEGCGSGGCGTTGDGARGLFGLFAILAAALLLARRRLGRFLPLVVLGTVLALGLMACSDGTPSGPTPPARCTSDADCKPDETCHLDSGLCIPAGGCRSDADCAEGQYCAGDLDGDGRRDCAFKRCTSDAECATEVACNSPEIPRCIDGACGCGEPCGGACPEGQYCCSATDSCTPVPQACVVSCTSDGQCSSFGSNGKCVGGQCACAPGYTLNVQSQGQVDPTQCALTGTSCVCGENPPVPLGDIGRWTDAALVGDQLWVSGYNATYGDLVVGKYDALQGTFTWTFVDGVPAAGAVTGAPTGPRGGVLEPGDDVGIETSIAAASDGTLHIAYHDKTNGVLKYARVMPAVGGTLASSTHVVDDTGTTGRFTSIVLDAAGAPAIAYMTATRAEGAATKSEAKLARARSASPGATGDWDRVVLHERTLPVNESLVVGLPEGTGLFNSLTLAADGKLWNAFYDRLGGNLMLATVGGTTVESLLLVDGEAAGGVDTGDVGQWASLRLTGDGRAHITYVNATTDELWHATVTGGNAVTEVIDTGLRTAAGQPVGPNNPEPQGDTRIVASHLVGDDSSLVVGADGSLRVAYMNSTEIDLMYGTYDPATGKWSLQTLAGNETPYTGAYGFHVSQVADSQGFLIVNYKFNLQDETSAVDVRRAP